MKNFCSMKFCLAAAAILLLNGSARAGEGYVDTPLLPGGKWHVHDKNRPHPPVVTPGPATEPMAPPADAVVLFDGKDLSQWGGGTWKVENGFVEANKTGNITTKEKFGSCQLHIEWMEPKPQGSGQGRGNSGVFLMGRYEIQVLDSYKSETYADGQCAGIYGQTPPLVNACRPPGEWQTYDIAFEAPVFKDGKILKHAFVTIFQNGVLVQNHTEILGGTSHRSLPSTDPHGEKESISLQDHGNPIRYRNIWIRPVKSIEETPAADAAK